MIILIVYQQTPSMCGTLNLNYVKRVSTFVQPTESMATLVLLRRFTSITNSLLLRLF